MQRWQNAYQTSGTPSVAQTRTSRACVSISLARLRPTSQRCPRSPHCRRPCRPRPVTRRACAAEHKCAAGSAQPRARRARGGTCDAHGDSHTGHRQQRQGEAAYRACAARSGHVHAVSVRARSAVTLKHDQLGSVLLDIKTTLGNAGQLTQLRFQCTSRVTNTPVSMTKAQVDFATRRRRVLVQELFAQAGALSNLQILALDPWSMYDDTAPEWVSNSWSSTRSCESYIAACATGWTSGSPPSSRHACDGWVVCAGCVC